MNHLTIQEQTIIRQIQSETNKKNIDNISRTAAYFSFFKKNPDIIWSFLASMVSRNGGWNMCDLVGSDISPTFRLNKRENSFFLPMSGQIGSFFMMLFLSYCSINIRRKLSSQCFIYFPILMFQLLSKKNGIDIGKKTIKNRLTTALIINEQNVIQTPVIEHPVYKKKVFHSMLFSFQDWLHFSCVLFPTCGGEVYGASVNGFKSLSKRIDLGKRLASILFHPRLFPHFFEFAERTPHTGSRYDYEQYFKRKTIRKTPILRTSFPVIEHHQRAYEDWSLHRRVSPTWLYFAAHHRHSIHITDWYIAKSNQLHLLLSLQRVLELKKWE